MRMVGNGLRHLEQRVKLLPVIEWVEFNRWLNHMTCMVENACRYTELVPQAAELALAAYPPCERRGESGRWLAPLALLAQRLAGGNTAAEVRVLQRLGQEYRLQSQLETAVEHHTRALDVAYRVENVDLLAQGHWQLAEDYLRQDALLPAQAQAEQARKLFKDEEAHPELWQGALINILGIIAVRLKDYETAVHHFEKAQQLHLALALPVEAGRNCLNIGWALTEQGDVPGAQAAYEQALVLVADHAAERANVLNNWGALCAGQKEYKAALEHFYEADTLLRTHSNLARHGEVLHNISFCLRMLGRFAEAIPVARQAIQIREQLRADLPLSFSLSVLARSLLMNEQGDEGLATYDRAIQLVQGMPGQQKWYQDLVQYKQSFLPPLPETE